MRSNKELTRFLDETADLLSFKGEIFFRIKAFREAAQTIEHLEENIKDIADRNELEKLPGIGKGMVKRINDYLITGDFEEHRKLLLEIPEGILRILEIPGMGPKKAKILYERLEIKNINDLKNSILRHELKDIEGFGEKTETNIIDGIEKRERYSQRILLSEADEIASVVIKRLNSIKGVEKSEIAGSLRRRKETIGDIDILYISSRPGKEVGREFTRGFEEEDVIALGDKKTSCIWGKICQVDLRKINKDQWGAALQYFTGSKEHSVALRKCALRKNVKVNEYGVWKDDVREGGKTEKDFYSALGADYIPPELRENMGEIEAAVRHTLPRLVDLKDIIGDSHVHSKYSDGSNGVEEIALKAQELGYEWIVISDHSQSLKIANGLDERRLIKKMKEIEAVNKKLDIEVLCGQEVDIKNNGALDYPDRILKKIDMVMVAIHAGFNQPEEKITNRIIRAIENPYVHIICHLTGRLLNEREPYAVNVNKIIKKAAKTGTAIEINAHPMRLDLYDYFVKQAKENGVKLAIGTDAHHVNDLKFMRYGVSVARRGWLEKKNLLNTMNFKTLKSFISK